MKNRKYIDYTLPHGGKLRYVKNKVSKSTMFEIRFDGGTRLNTIPGLAHFVEHMFFTGTDELSKEEVSNKYYDYIRVNAQTSIKDIAFTGNVITKEFSSYLDLLNQMLTKSTFTQEAVEKECKIIQQEIASYRDRHYSKAWWLNNYNLFGREEYKYEILGTEKSVASVKSEDVKEYVKNNIVAESLIVNVTSPLSFRKIKRLIVEKIESKINSNPNFKFLPYWGDKLKKEKFLCLKYKDIGKTYITINFAFDFNVFDFETKRKIFLSRRGR